jgi:hypothetical protein
MTGHVGTLELSGTASSTFIVAVIGRIGDSKAMDLSLFFHVRRVEHNALVSHTTTSSSSHPKDRFPSEIRSIDQTKFMRCRLIKHLSLEGDTERKCSQFHSLKSWLIPNLKPQQMEI